jgi:hypothetical protein
MFIVDCSDPDMTIATAGFSAACGVDDHACTEPTWPRVDVSQNALLLPITIHMRPGFHSNGGAHTNRDITHELGHALGHADYDGESYGCPFGQPTLMDGDEICYYTTPQQLDEDNYHNAYHVNAPTNPTWQFVGGGLHHQIKIIWNEDDLHNESGFLIVRQDPCQYGTWVWADGVNSVAAKNATSHVLMNQPGGEQFYQVMALTNADPEHPTLAGDPSSVINASLSSSLAQPGNLKSKFTTTSNNRISWTAVTGADHYKVRSDIFPNGTFMNCSASLTATQYDTAVPPATAQFNRVPFYYKVMACNAADLCSMMSGTYVVTERVNDGTWKYAFTYFRGSPPVGGVSRLAPGSDQPPQSGIKSINDVRRLIYELVRKIFPFTGGASDEKQYRGLGAPLLQEGPPMTLQFINFGGAGLQLHVRNDGTTTGPIVHTTGCLNSEAGANVSGLETMPGSSFAPGSVLGTQGLSGCEGGTFSPYIGLGFVPP